MTLLERYIFRLAGGAFAVSLVALTGVIWLTQALRQFNLITSKGQTVFVFIRLTLLQIPNLLMIIAPFALFGAVLYALNKLNSDSELIVMNAAGLRPRRTLRPFALLAALVSAMVAYVSLDAMPQSFRSSRDMLTKIRADLVSKIIQEGKFVELDQGITFHYREKKGETLFGILIQDRRDTSRISTYLAERGQVVEADGKTFMVLEHGSVHRQSPTQRDSNIVAYESYGIDLDQFGGAGSQADAVAKPRERSTAELLRPEKTDFYTENQRGRLRAELHERFVNPLFPVAAMAIAFAALGVPRTTRQGRGSAMALAILAVVTMRILAFAASTLVVRHPAAVWLLYGVPLLTVALSAAALQWQSGYGRLRWPTSPRPRTALVMGPA